MPSFGITDSATPVDMSGYEFILKYTDGTNTYQAALNTNLTEVKSWYDLANQLQDAINNDPNLKDKVVVSYDGSPNGGLVLQTKTSNVTPGVTPGIEISGTGVKKYLGSISALSDTGKAVVTKDWTGRTFYIDTGNGWEEVTTVANFKEIGGPDVPTGLDKVTSGEDLAQKLQALLDARTAIPGTDISPAANMTDGASNDAGTVGNVTMAGKYTGTSDGEITVTYDGTNYNIIGPNDVTAVTITPPATSAIYKGLTIDISGITTGPEDGDTWTYGVKADKPSTNVAVTWNIDHLEFATVGTPKDGITVPQIRIRDAVDLIGYTDRTEKGSNSADWSSKDFFIEYNGSKYTFTEGEKKEAGFGNIISGESLKVALTKLIDKKIGENKVKVEYANDGKLLLQTIDNDEIGQTPEINIGGSDAADLIGDKPDKVSGTAASVTPPAQDKAGIIKLVTFQNPEGLEKVGGNLFGTSVSSGDPKEGQANQSGFGTINSCYLEMSNVDLTEEFTNMITTQRGYQANARVITVSDSLLEELIQLKR